MQIAAQLCLIGQDHGPCAVVDGDRPGDAERAGVGIVFDGLGGEPRLTLERFDIAAGDEAAVGGDDNLVSHQHSGRCRVLRQDAQR